MKLRTITTILVAIPVLLVSSGLLAWWWLLHTEPGARWVFDRAVAASNVPVRVKRISGDLYSGLQLDEFHFEEAGTRADVEILRVAIHLDLLPFAVEVTTLQAENIRIQVTPDSATQPGEKGPPGAVAMPFPISFSDVRISGLEYLDPSGEASFLISTIEGAGSLEETLVLDRLSISHQENRLDLSGRIAGTPPYSLAVKFQSQGLLAVDGSLDGDLDAAELVLDFLEPQAHVSGTLGQLLGVPVWDLEVHSPSILLPPGSPEPAATLSKLQAQTTGEWPLFDLDLAATLEIPGIEPAQLTVSGNGSSNHFTAQKLTLQGPELSLDASGAFSWEDTLRLNLNVVLDRLEPRTWIPEWPQNHPVNGHLVIGWEGEDLAINDFSLAVPATSFVATGRGIVAPESGLVDVSLNWENFSWPIDSLSPAIASDSGSLQVKGRPEKWQLGGVLDLRNGDFPPGRLQLSGTGDDESLDIILEEGKVLGGTISGSVFWNWKDSQPFRAEVAANRLDITPLFPEYPGVLNTRLSLNGEVEPFSLSVDVQQLDGTILEQPVDGRGGIHIQQGRVFADQLHLGSGLSSLDLDGSLYEPGGITFATDIDSLDRFSTGFQGSLAAKGTISLNPDSPRMSVSLSGQNLVFGPVAIEHMESRKPDGSGFADGSEINLSGLVIGPRAVDSASIRFGGAKPFQKVSVQTRLEDTDIALELNGSVIDWSDPLTSGWRGELSDLRIDRQGQFLLTLDQAAALEWTPSRFTLDSFCLTGDARLCMASNWHREDQFNITAELAKIPAGLFKLIADTELEFTQILSGNLEWSQSVANGRKGTARLELSPGSISLPDDDEMLLKTGAGRFGFELAAGVLQKGDLDLNIPGMGDIDIDFNIPDLSLGTYSPVRGKVRVDFDDLAALGPLLPLFDSINGALDIDVNLSGILSNPAFEGKASLTDGHFSNQASGFSFSEINIAGDVSEMDRSRLKGTFRAGEGSGSIDATIYFEDLFSPVIELSLKGESLTVIDVPDLNVIANPDLALGWRDGTLEINGRLLIPKARLAPSYIPQASVRQSTDVVIVSGALPEPEDDYLRDNPVRIRGSLEIELGKQAQIDLEMAKVRVFGTTRFTWQDELLPKADGNFDVRGEIQAYGQFLKITQGRISFPDSPADNPYLNIRAERDIYGNTQIQKAGLMVSGTLKRPLIEPFTIPMTNKDRARTLLVTGSDFNYEQGVGAVAVGAYVLPRLYISYGIGVFEEGSVISARYDLGKRFGVKATSGQNDTGVDLNYTIER